MLTGTKGVAFEKVIDLTTMDPLSSLLVLYTFVESASLNSFILKE